MAKTWHHYGTKYHHVAIVHDNGTHLAVFKHWNYRKQRWEYRVEPLYAARVVVGHPCIRVVNRQPDWGTG